MKKYLLYNLLVLFMLLGGAGINGLNAQSASKSDELKTNVYPSEIKDNYFFFTIEGNDSELSEVNLKIANLIGTEVEYDIDKMLDGRFKVTLNNAVSGIYIIRISKGNKQSIQRVVVRPS